MTESANSSQVSITPEFSSDRYSKPTWKVLINSIEYPTAILEKIELGYGSDMSTATFYLPISLDDPKQPEEEDTVTIIVNDKTLFKGIIRVITKHLGIDGQKITYTCLSNLVKKNDTTVIYGELPAQLSAKNALINTLHLPVTNGPLQSIGSTNITDETILQAAETILGRVGNYKLYYDMPTDTYDVYKLGTGGINTRNFLFGKNVVTYDITKNTENVVDRVIVVGPTGDYRRSALLNPDTMNLSTAPSGKTELYFTLPLDARDIVVEGLGNQQPTIKFSNSVMVSKKMLHIFEGQNTTTFGQSGGTGGRVKKLDFNDDITVLNEGEDDLLKPAVISHETYNAEWSQIGTEIKQSATAQQIFLTDIPKKWTAHFVSGYVLNSEAGIDRNVKGEELTTLEINTGRTQLDIMDYPEFTWTMGALRVIYTEDLPQPSVQIGTGPVFRSLTDSQYKVTVDTTTGYNNSGVINTQMNIRANAEYDKLHVPAISGNITVLGDESIELKTTIIAENETLDILHITHSFESGFTTTVTLTNEKFIPQINTVTSLPPRKITDTERDKRRNLLIQHINSDLLSKLDKQKSGDDKQILQAPKQGSKSFLSK